tara:strand:+ start:765 stop:1265 length:501 start_codon:yes stop_codon:yes gene_type:complete
VSRLGAADLADVRCSTAPETFDADLRALLCRQDLDPEAFRYWQADMCSLPRHFFTISHAREAQFRLATTDADDCRRLHVDRRRLRLICTYQGPGTQWLADAQVNRTALAQCAPNDAVLRHGEPSQFEPFWVGLMQGDPGNNGQGLVHRSPPIAGSGQVRVLFCMDC